MLTLLIAAAAAAAFVTAYRTYGRWLERDVFGTDAAARTPAHQLRDDSDFVPTRRAVLFGHHFTSIAGTGPIVGPAIAVFWGWLPALLWVVLGSIFVGAVHDFGALFVSLRNRGQTVGQVAGRLINPRARVLFLSVLFFALTIVLGIFGLVIATIFNLYPQSVLSVWTAMPLAVLAGWAMRRTPTPAWVVAAASLLVLYAAVWVGVYHLPLTLEVGNPIMTWTALLMAYCFAASVLPVWLLLQPRDFVNSQQLFVALALLIAGLAVAGVTGQADIMRAAPAVASSVPADAPPILPFLFITIACGACSGFHCVVSSGTTSKQVNSEADARPIAYGGMLLEGMLAVLVILCCTAGLGLGRFDFSGASAVAVTAADGQPLTGRAAWAASYGGETFNLKLGPKLAAFVEGGANFLTQLGLPPELGVGVIAVLVACFAATTLDTTTRLQRYVVQEMGSVAGIRPLQNKYLATGVAVSLGLIVAAVPGSGGVAGTGGLLLWPLFGATNQLLAGLALLVTAFYLRRRGKPVWFLAVPTALMVLLPAWALGWNLVSDGGWLDRGDWLLVALGAGTLALQIWMVFEAALLWPRVRNVLEVPAGGLPATDAAVVPS